MNFFVDRSPVGLRLFDNDNQGRMMLRIHALRVDKELMKISAIKSRVIDVKLERHLAIRTATRLSLA
jgi:hypothetical protein